MSSARWVMVLGLLGASGCGGIPIVSGDPFVPDAGEEPEADVSATTDLGRDADPMDAHDAADAGTLDANDAGTLDANDGADSDQPEVRGVDAPLAEVSRAEVFVNDSATAVDIELPADDSATPCALCMRGSGSAMVCCSARCRDLQTDRFNCGACGVVCPGTDDCVGGSCLSSSCPTGAVLCGGACFDLRSSPAHCGSCLLACTPGQSCILGVCSFPFDAAVRDVAVADTGAFDAGAPDVASLDTGAFDAGAPEVASFDLGAPEVASFDSGGFDAGAPEVALVDQSTPILGADGGVE